MAARNYANIRDLGPWIDERHERLYARSRELYGAKPILIDPAWNSDPSSNGGIYEDGSALTVFLKPTAPNPSYTFAHELGHAINQVENDVPMMRPSVPQRGTPLRRILGELLSLLDHPLVHDFLAGSGFADDVANERRERSRYFLETDFPTIPRGPLAPAASAWVGLGYANLATTYRDDELLPQIEDAMTALDPRILEVGRLFAARTTALLGQSPDEVLAGAIELAREIPVDATSLFVKRSQLYR